jgi:hypothetical protein
MESVTANSAHLPTDQMKLQDDVSVLLLEQEVKKLTKILLHAHNIFFQTIRPMGKPIS